MKAKHVIMTGLAVLGIAGAAHAQVASQTEKVAGEAKVETVKMTGEVVYVQGNLLFAKMQPLGNLQSVQREAGSGVHHRRTDEAYRRPQAGHGHHRDGHYANDAGHRAHDEHAQRDGLVGPGQLRRPDARERREQGVPACPSRSSSWSRANPRPFTT